MADKKQMELVQTEAEKNQGNRPIRTYKLGALQIAKWQRQTAVDGKLITREWFTYQRSYKDGQGNWQNTQTISREDIPRLQILLHQVLVEKVEVK